MAVLQPILQEGIPGVFAARQSRSIKNRDGFIRAGVAALNTTRFDEVRISDLARASQNSVGSFYTRFQDKDAFFGALRAHALDAIDRELVTHFTVDALRALPPEQALDALVDLMGAIFASRFRGVLRESYLRIMDVDEPWAPVRSHAMQVVERLHVGLGDAFPHYAQQETKTRLSFCFQLVVGVLQNDLVNNYHVFKLEDGTVLDGLKETLRAYMAAR